MAEDRPEPDGPSPDPARPKRTPPTIDLEATEVSSETAKASADAQPEPALNSEPEAETAAAPVSEAPSEPVAKPAPRPISPWVVAPVSGAVAAALVIGVGWLLGWPAVQPASNTAATDSLGARIAGLESKLAKPVAAAADPAAAARTEALEKSLAALRGELAGQRAQSEKLAAALNDAKAAPRDGAAAPDLSAVNARIEKIESAVRTQSAAIAKQDGQLADNKAADIKAADDVPLRRVVAASLLDVAVRHGDDYAAPLAAAKAYADDAGTLKPLEAFAAAGVPNPAMLCGELLEIVPKLSPPAPVSAATTGSSFVDRLTAGAAKLVRIERTDAAGTDRGSVVARVTASALRNDVAEARRELKTLPVADRTAAQAWLDKTDAREAALAASRKFADNAMAALAKAGQ